MNLGLRDLSYFLRGRFWLRIWHEVNEDDCWGMAAQLSYYLLLAFFPFLIFLSAVISYIPNIPDLLARLLLDLRNFVPEPTHRLITSIFESVAYSHEKGLLTVGLASSLWFASGAINAMIALLNKAYQVRETRSYFYTRTLAVLVTIVVSIFSLASGVLIFFGDWVVDLLSDSDFLQALFTGIRWILIVGILNIGVQIVFHFVPAGWRRWRWISPGGLLASIGAVVGSQLFRGYVNRYATLHLLWGSLSALIALMLWFYLCSFFLLLGGEIDSEIEKMKREGL